VLTGVKIKVHKLHTAVYSWVAKQLRTERGRGVAIAMFAFAIGAFVCKLAFINDWFNLLCFITGGLLGVASALLFVYYGDTV